MLKSRQLCKTRPRMVGRIARGETRGVGVFRPQPRDGQNSNSKGFLAATPSQQLVNRLARVESVGRVGERKENLLANTLFPRLSKMCSDLQKSRPPAGHGVSIAHSLHICEQKGGGGEEKSRGTGLESSRNVVSTLAKRSPRADRSEERVQKFDHSFHADSALYKGRGGERKVRRNSSILADRSEESG